MKTRLIAVALLALAGLYAATPARTQSKRSVGVESFTASAKGGWLGVSIQDLTPKIVKKKGLKNDEGAYVNDVVEKSPADSAGVEEGDVIVEFNGHKIDGAEDLTRAVRKVKPGTKTTIVVLRSNEKKSLDIAVGKPKRKRMTGGMAMAPHMTFFGTSRIWGLQLSTLTDQLGEYFGAPNGKGLLVEQVDNKSKGEKAGFKAGDVITKVNKKSIEEYQDLREATENLDEGDKLDVEVLRKGTTKVLSLEVEEADIEPSFFDFRFEGIPNGHMMKEFHIDGFPGDEIEDLQMQIRKSLPDLRDLRMKIERMRSAIGKVTV